MKGQWVIGTTGQPVRYKVYCENGDLERADAIKLAVRLLLLTKATSEEIAAAWEGSRVVLTIDFTKNPGEGS